MGQSNTTAAFPTPIPSAISRSESCLLSVKVLECSEMKLSSSYKMNSEFHSESVDNLHERSEEKIVSQSPF